MKELVQFGALNGQRLTQNDRIISLIHENIFVEEECQETEDVPNNKYRDSLSTP
jgi:hypothetical protein